MIDDKLKSRYSRPIAQVLPTIVGPPTAIDLERKISVLEAATLNNLSVDTFYRHHRHLIKQISPRRSVVRLGDALALGEAKSG
jgi:hypothetical protein